MNESIKMNQEAFHDITTYSININKNEEVSCAWRDSLLAVRSEKGMHFYELAHDINCLDKKINCLQTYLPSVKTRASAKLFSNKVIHSTMSNSEYIEMIHDQSLWPHNSQLMDELTCVIAFEWSPDGLLPSQEPALAVLNNVGGVDLFMRHNSKWQHLLEVTASFAEAYIKRLKEPKGYSELKEAAHILSTTAICWAPILMHEKSCYIATAQKNNTIMLWLISSLQIAISVQFHGSIETGTAEIVKMKWIQKSNNHLILVCSNIHGQIIFLDCQIQNSLLQLNKSHTVWPCEDRMISRYIQHIVINDKIILICNKHRHLMVLMIDDQFNICGQNITNINDYRLTSINNSTDEIYVTTVNRKIFKINIALIENDLSVSLCPIDYKEPGPTNELCDVSFSQNGAFCILVFVDRKVNYRKESMKINVTFTTTHGTLDSLVDVLLKNPTRKLTNYYDIIELLRYKCMKCKEAPQVNYRQLYDEGLSDIYLIKLYLIFVTLYNNLRKLKKVYPLPDIPEESLDMIREEILLHHAEKLFVNYNEKRQLKGYLDGFENETFLGAINFLEYYCKKTQRNLYDLLKFDKATLGDVDCQYVCQCCDEKIEGFSCKNDHLNMFCCLTFTPIEGDDYLVCPWCDHTYRLELLSENPMCLFCDVYLRIEL